MLFKLYFFDPLYIVLVYTDIYNLVCHTLTLGVW